MALLSNKQWEISVLFGPCNREEAERKADLIQDLLEHDELLRMVLLYSKPHRKGLAKVFLGEWTS